MSSHLDMQPGVEFLDNTLHIDRGCLRVLLFLNAEHKILHPSLWLGYQRKGSTLQRQTASGLNHCLDLLIWVQMFNQWQLHYLHYHYWIKPAGPNNSLTSLWHGGGNIS